MEARKKRQRSNKKEKSKEASVKKVKDIMDTSAWKEAEWIHSGLYAQTLFPLGGMNPSPSEIDGYMEEILERCPGYFPALFQRGGYMLSTGNTLEGEKFIEKGFEWMEAVIKKKEELYESISNAVEQLEKLLRFDLEKKYLEKAARLFPGKADLYDDLAYCILQLPDGDQNEALELHKKALDMEPKNSDFLSNLGWTHLIMGNYEEAEIYIKKSLELKKNNEIARGNLKILKYIAKKNLTFFDYLLRPVDMKKLDALSEKEETDKVVNLCREYNIDRLDAFKSYHMKSAKFPPHVILDIMQTIKIFMGFVDKITMNEIFLYEDIDLIHVDFKYFMHKFIFKFGDVDDKTLDDVYRSLTHFYDFLREFKLIESGQYVEFIKDIDGLKDELFHKMHEYNKIRRDDTMSEEEKEEIREELFEGDHSFF
jgi:tetratricopeptide (TPR) repeat protein